MLFINENKHVQNLCQRRLSWSWATTWVQPCLVQRQVLHQHSAFPALLWTVWENRQPSMWSSEIASGVRERVRACAWVPTAKEQWCTAGMCSVQLPCSTLSLASGNVYSSCDSGLVRRYWGSSKRQGQKCGSSLLIWVIFNPLFKMMKNVVFFHRRNSDCCGLLKLGDGPQGLGRE